MARRRPAPAATRVTDTQRGQRCVLYLRLSDLDDADLNEQGEAKTFGARETKLRELADFLGWVIVKVIIENDVNRGEGRQRNASAFKRRKITQPDGSVIFRVIRPGFQSIVRGLANGTYDALLAEDLDRTMRDPYDCEDLIAAARATKANARSLSSSLTLTDGGTDSEITMARFLVTIANKSSLDTSRRVADGRERKALAGEFGGGRRPFGFEPDGVTKRWDECMIINAASYRVLKLDGRPGVKPASLRMLVAELREAEVPTVTGAKWSTSSLRDILLRPRNAGLMELRGQEVGAAPWSPIVPEPVYRAVVRLLTDPSRRTNSEANNGATPRWQGTGIFRCGVCNDGTTCWASGGTQRAPRYACKAHNHLARQARNVDEFVRATVIEYLSRPDAAGVFAAASAPNVVDESALYAEAAALRDGMNELAADRAQKLISRETYVFGLESAQKRLKDIEGMLSTVVDDSPVLALLSARDVAAAWDAQPLAIRRVVLDTLFTVVLNPARLRGAHGFDYESITITPKVPTSGQPDQVDAAEVIALPAAA